MTMKALLSRIRFLLSIDSMINVLGLNSEKLFLKNILFLSQIVNNEFDLNRNNIIGQFIEK